MKCQVTQDAHMQAFDWLEDHLKENLHLIDTDDWIGLIEQVVARGL